MALINKLKAIADAIRKKTGTTDPLTLDEMADKITNLESTEDTYILVDEDGNEYAAVMTEEPVALTATPNDIRIGTIAVTDDGVTVGEKEIPSYHTSEGMRVVMSGKEFVIDNLGRHCEFTKLQALACLDSVSAQAVCINTKVYAVDSTEVLSEVTVDTESQVINFGITNDTTKPYVIRYFTYKEEY